jgi:DNA-binding GntR family transcriptional regulator
MSTRLAKTVPPSRLSEQIRNDVVAGIYPFGARLRIDELANRYRVSHMPVREALRELHGEGLVVIEQNRGARVRSVDSTFVENIFDIRSAIETMLACRAAERRSADHLARLEVIEARLEAQIDAGDFAAVLQANREFHDVINEAAANTEATQIAGGHWLMLAALWARFGYKESRFVGVVSDHRHLIRALAARDTAATAAIMSAHVAKAKQDLLEQMRHASSALSPVRAA